MPSPPHQDGDVRISRDTSERLTAGVARLVRPLPPRRTHA
jgi:hypothetical protein